MPRTNGPSRKAPASVAVAPMAKTLLAKRRQDTILGKKQPELLRARALTFNDLCDDAIKHSEAKNSEKQTYELRLRIEQLRPVFGSRSADSIRKNEVVEWLTEQAEEREWASTTRNRWQATFSLIFRVGMDNEKIERNPAARIRKKAEGAYGSRQPSTKRRCLITRGIATAIRLPVDLLWPEWTCELLQNCLGIGHFKWSCATHISLRSTRHRL